MGRRFRYGRSGGWIEVVGLIEDGKYVSLTASPQPAVFESILQSHSNNVRLLARASVPVADAVSSMRAAIARLDPALGQYETQSLDDMLALARFPNRAAAIALSAFGALAMLLAVTGMYGTVSHAVARRRKEIGIRIAIGARTGQVLRLVLIRTLACVAGGAIAGAALVLLAGRILSSVVYGVSPRDPVALAAVAAAFLTAGAAACWLPARQALAIDPVSTLKSE